ncbi:PAS domain S-box-containing protein [Algoriella xinjiangensis]|uniref:histidine kinase n=2 Tax=Algoriella xinjiangensis TaxID=684065 RepID=A0A1I4VJ58_9FLAO|nr:PAS domain S-box-containing protein [Algoriella xinjiangensis]VDH17200.1 Alkaline phosphatase synthesis sensor protein phoR [Algoriella xinjiangensis]
MPQFIWTADKNGIVTYFNKKWFNYFGLPENSDPNNTFWDLLHPDYHDKVFYFWHDCVANNKAYEIEYQLRVSENPAEYKWFLARGTPVYNSDNEIEIWIGTSTDIDDFKLLQKQKDDFLGIASHELKTPLTSLKLYSQFIEMNLKKQGDLKNADLAHKMEAQINKLNNLITDLLDVTKIQNGKMLLQEQEFELADLVLEITEEQQMSTNHKITLEIESSGKIFGDRDRIGQVLTNLMSNAIKYSPDDNRVLIKVFQADKNVKVVVQDFGIGIPADKIDKVFDQYMRVESKYEKTISGLGLGLYISSEIIKRSHGNIYVTSEEGKGSNFCFELPITTTNL